MARTAFHRRQTQVTEVIREEVSSDQITEIKNGVKKELIGDAGSELKNKIISDVDAHLKDTNAQETKDIISFFLKQQGTLLSDDSFRQTIPYFDTLNVDTTILNRTSQGYEFTDFGKRLLIWAAFTSLILQHHITNTPKVTLQGKTLSELIVTIGPAVLKSIVPTLTSEITAISGQLSDHFTPNQ